MQLSIYYDYACEDSHTVFRWLEKVTPQRPELHLTWATFSLNELNRAPEAPSCFEADAPPAVSITALALAHAARQADFSLYHQLVFSALHEQGVKLNEEALFDWARQAGVDIDAFRAERPRWLQEVAHDHEYGRRRWGVKATPTLVVNTRAVAMLKLAEPPQNEARAMELLDRLGLLLIDFPEIMTVKRPG